METSKVGWVVGATSVVVTAELEMVLEAAALDGGLEEITFGEKTDEAAPTEVITAEDAAAEEAGETRLDDRLDDRLDATLEITLTRELLAEDRELVAAAEEMLDDRLETELETTLARELPEEDSELKMAEEEETAVVPGFTTEDTADETLEDRLDAELEITLATELLEDERGEAARLELADVVVVVVVATPVACTALIAPTRPSVAGSKAMLGKLSFR